jgi:NAD(P)H-nitrite reductase large subunit
MLSKENSVPYNRCVLADCLSGKKEYKSAYLRTADYFKEHHISFMPNHTVIGIDTQNKKITCHNGVSFHFDTLLLAFGLEPRIPLTTALKEEDGYFQFYGLSSLLSLEKYIQQKRPVSALIMGAGLSGIECADALLQREIQVTLIDPAPRVLATLTTDAISSAIEEAGSIQGLKWCAGVRAVEIEKSEDGLKVFLNDGSAVEVNCVVAATGGSFSPVLLNGTAIEYTPEGIMVKNTLETSVPGIYAAGDCIAVYDKMARKRMPSRLWPDAMQQGAVAASNMAGVYKEYAGSNQIAASSFFEKQFLSAGCASRASRLFNAPEASVAYNLNEEGTQLIAACGFASSTFCRQLSRALAMETIPLALQVKEIDK